MKKGIYCQLKKSEQTEKKTKSDQSLERYYYYYSQFRV